LGLVVEIQLPTIASLAEMSNKLHFGTDGDVGTELDPTLFAQRQGHFQNLRHMHEKKKKNIEFWGEQTKKKEEVENGNRL
jgi:ribosomal protein L27